MAIVDVPEQPVIEPKNVIGVDMGIANISVDSTGKYYSGEKVKEVREHNLDLRSKLQSVNTKSAKRHIKKLSGKEHRFATNTNHIISKETVNKAKGTSSAIAIEDLTGIRMRETVKKGNRYMHNSWAFYQLRLFIEYKAKEAGIPVIIIDPHNTSRECPNCHTISKKNFSQNMQNRTEDAPNCHTISKKNRPGRSVFKCISCGLKGEADYVASLNIRNRAVANQPIVAGDLIVHCDSPVASSLL